ncbi:MAG: hypothetical protein ABEJ86_07235 [Halococcoides sp.]
MKAISLIREERNEIPDRIRRHRLLSENTFEGIFKFTLLEAIQNLLDLFVERPGIAAMDVAVNVVELRPRANHDQIARVSRPPTVEFHRKQESRIGNSAVEIVGDGERFDSAVVVEIVIGHSAPVCRQPTASMNGSKVTVCFPTGFSYWTIRPS